MFAPATRSLNEVVQDISSAVLAKAIVKDIGLFTGTRDRIYIDDGEGASFEVLYYRLLASIREALPGFEDEVYAVLALPTVGVEETSGWLAERRDLSELNELVWRMLTSMVTEMYGGPYAVLMRNVCGRTALMCLADIYGTEMAEGADVVVTPSVESAGG